MAIKASVEPTWHRAGPAPVVLVSGPEEVLAGRAIEKIAHAMRGGDAPVGLDQRIDETVDDEQHGEHPVADGKLSEHAKYDEQDNGDNRANHARNA